jgi:hypothetical protein
MKRYYYCMMLFLQKLFLIRKIYTRRTAAALLGDTFVIGVFIFGLFAFLSIVRFQPSPTATEEFSLKLAEQLPVVLIPVVLWLIYVVRSLVKGSLAKGRSKAVRRVAALGGVPSMFAMSTLAQQEDNPSRHSAVARSLTWQQYEIEVDIYRQTKYGQYLSRQNFYSVFEIQLSRQLPNIMFDSKRAKNEQFKYLYLKSQRISLEGGFDDTFTVYAPEHYAIDTLSFITPEVMLAFRDAHDYDIELAGDRLFMYGPLLLNEQDAARMRELGERLGREINDNIDNYADSYLSGPTRRTSTTQFARRLQRSPLKPAALLVLSLIVAAAPIALQYAVRRNMGLSDITLFGLAFAAKYGWDVFTILRDNKQARASFIKDVQYHALVREQRQKLFGRPRF